MAVPSVSSRTRKLNRPLTRFVVISSVPNAPSLKQGAAESTCSGLA